MYSSVVELTQALIRINSVNPDDASTIEGGGEKTLAESLAAWLQQWGANVELEEIRPNRPNLIARWAPMDGRPRVLFGPHLDTVGIDNMTVEAFGGHLVNGTITGRGASDTKGPMAAMLWALKENLPLLAKSPVAIDFVAFMGEESGQWGSKHFAQHHGAHYQFAIAGEPTSQQIVTATKGSLWSTVVAKGKACHSSMPEQGDNAVMKLARALDVLEKTLQPRLASYTHPLLGKSTMNIGIFQGGTRANIVPDFAQAQLDIRITPALTAAGGAEHLLASTIQELGLPLTMVNTHENPPMETDRENPYIQCLLASRPGTECVVAPWFSDAAHLSQGGIPSVCLGPGSIEQAHKEDEFIRIDDLQAGVEQFSQFIQQLQKW
jgi:acetylornithine deacetylase